MTGLTGLLLLVAGLSGLAVTGALVACCIGIRSPTEFLLATYVIAWAWLVTLTLALSPPRLVTRWSLAAGLAAGLLGAFAAWHYRGRPGPPALRGTLEEVRRSLRSPFVLILALTVALGALYCLALALLTPANDGDALAYHIARAAFWRQEHGVGYVANANDIRLNINPPNAEIGQLATMLLSGSDRYVAVPQLVAFVALVLSVAALSRRIGLSVEGAVFGALAFATLPIVAVQAPSALNDLVVASFLTIAAVFALRPDRSHLALFALALGLAVGTKFTALFALPALALVLLACAPRRTWSRIGVAGLVGLTAGSVWYVLNLVETGKIDGGLADTFDQRGDVAAPAIVMTALRLGLDVVDMSGTPRPHSAVFLGAAGLLAALAAVRARSSRRLALGLCVASLLTASVYAVPEVFKQVQDLVFRSWAVLGRPTTAPFEYGWNLNVEADPVLSWYGPLGALMLVGGPVVVAALWRRRTLPVGALALALAPWVLLLTLAATIVWDPFRGRLLVFGVALAAATWGSLLRSEPAAAAIATIGAVSLTFSLLNYHGKPSGLARVWDRDDPPVASVHTIWNDSRPDALTRLRPSAGEDLVFRYLEQEVPSDAHLALALQENALVSPYFGRRLSRHVSFVSRDRGGVPAEAEWLVLGPSTSVSRCRDAWRSELTLASGWRVDRRIAPDSCSRVATPDD